MRVTTLVKKLFGESSIFSMMDVLEEDAKEIEYWAIDTEEDAAEPTYFIRVYADGLHTLRDINGNTILSTYVEKDLKNKLKVLAGNPA